MWLTIAVIILLIFLYIILNRQYEGLYNKLYQWNNCKLNDKDKLINTFNNYGCIIIPEILSERECNNLLKIISKEEKNKKNETSNINSNYKRKDLILSLVDTKPYIKKIYSKIKQFCDELHPKGKIVESSSLISYPGCYPQIWHADTMYVDENEGNLTSFGIALQDTTENMGPLEVFLESNKLYKNDKEELMKKYKIKDQNLTGDYDDGIKYQMNEKLCNILNFKKGICSCKKGSLVIWSSKIIHRGGANKRKRRSVFYFSLLGSGKPPMGATYSFKKGENIEYINNI